MICLGIEPVRVAPCWFALCVEGGHVDAARAVLCAGASMALFDVGGTTVLIKSVTHMNVFVNTPPLKLD